MKESNLVFGGLPLLLIAAMALAAVAIVLLYVGVFVFDAVDDPARLQELANLGADNDIPVVAGVTSALFGQKESHGVAINLIAARA